MTGLPDYNYPAFNAAAAELRALGFEVDNPAEHFGGDQTLERKVYLRGDIEALLKVDAVVTLPGWHKSPGAQLETAIARALDLPVVRIEHARDLIAAEPAHREGAPVGYIGVCQCCGQPPTAWCLSTCSAESPLWPGVEARS